MTATPSRFLTYRGDASSIVGKTLGPNTLGEYLTAVTADFDGTQTRVGFVYGWSGGTDQPQYSVTETAFGRTVTEVRS